MSIIIVILNIALPFAVAAFAWRNSRATDISISQRNYIREIVFIQEPDTYKQNMIVYSSVSYNKHLTYVFFGKNPWTLYTGLIITLDR